MNQFSYDVLTCASILPVAGLDYNLFLRNLPNNETILAVIPLVKDRILRVNTQNIAFAHDLVETEDLSKHENPSAVLVFLEGLLKEMAACPRVEDNREYISVLHTFQNACGRFCGLNEDLDNKLAGFLASLVNLLEEPILHFISKDMKCDNKELLSVLCNAEEALVLKVLDRAYEATETIKQLKLFRFIYKSLQSISYVRHNWLGVNDSTEYVDNLIDLIDGRIAKLGVAISLEESSSEMKQEFGPLPGEED